MDFLGESMSGMNQVNSWRMVTGCAKAPVRKTIGDVRKRSAWWEQGLRTWETSLRWVPSWAEGLHGAD